MAEIVGGGEQDKNPDTTRGPRIGKTSGPNHLHKEVVEGGLSSAQEAVAKEIASARNRLGVSQISGLAREKLEEGDSKSAFGLASELSEATIETLDIFERRGYEVSEIKRKMQQGMEVHADAEAFERVDAIIDATLSTWDLMQGAFADQARKRTLEKITQPGSTQSIEARILQDMRTVWGRRFDDVKLGGRVEELRAKIGLRTLAALLARFGVRDAQGREDAMPKAYFWAQRAYHLTKQGIMSLGKRPEFREHHAELQALGRRYEAELGDQEIGRGNLFNDSSTPWDVISGVSDESRQVWKMIKKYEKEDEPEAADQSAPLHERVWKMDDDDLKRVWAEVMGDTETVRQGEIDVPISQVPKKQLKAILAQRLKKKQKKEEEPPF